MEQENDQISGCVKCEEDDERLSLIKRRMHALHFPNLQALSAHCILTNLQIFSTQNGPFALKNLPGTMREVLLRQLVSRSKIEMRQLVHFPARQFAVDGKYGSRSQPLDTFCQLLTSHCTHFNMDWIMVHCPEADKIELLIEVINQLRSGAPNLETLEFNLDFHTDVKKYDMHSIQAWCISDFWQSVLALKSLKGLKMPKQTVHPAELVALGENLPQLELLQCTLGKGDLKEYQEAAIKMVGLMPNLRNFEFTHNSQPLYENCVIKKFAFFCLMQFPQLETIGDVNFVHKYYVKWEMGAEELTPRLNQKRLNLWSDSQPDDYQTLIGQGMLPNVECLTVGTWYKAPWNMQAQAVLNFDKLTELTLIGIEDVMLILLECGHKLQKLTLLDCDEIVCLTTLVINCPKLKELHLQATRLDIDKSTVNTLDSLTKLEIDSVCCDDTNIGPLLATFPNLEHLEWREMDCFIEPVYYELRRLVKSGQIFRKLISLQIPLNMIYHTNPAITDFQATYIAALEEFIQDVCAYAPKLESINAAGGSSNFFELHIGCGVKESIDLVHELSTKNRLHF